MQSSVIVSAVDPAQPQLIWHSGELGVEAQLGTAMPTPAGAAFMCVASTVAAATSVLVTSVE
jgi:hypothetical protein